MCFTGALLASHSSVLWICVLLSSVAGMCSGVLSLQQGWDPSQEVEGGMWRGAGEGGVLPVPAGTNSSSLGACEEAQKLLLVPITHCTECGASLVAQHRPGEPAVCCSPPPGSALGRCLVVSLGSGRWFSRVREAAARCKRKFCRVGGEVKGELGATPRSLSCVWKNLFAGYMRY